MVAVVMCFITMLCWGSWANTQKLATKEWRFQLFYWDYCIGVVLLTLKLGGYAVDVAGSIELLSTKVGLVLLLQAIEPLPAWQELDLSVEIRCFEFVKRILQSMANLVQIILQ